MNTHSALKAAVAAGTTKTFSDTFFFFVTWFIWLPRTIRVILKSRNAKGIQKI